MSLAAERRRGFPRHAGDVLTVLRIVTTPVFVSLVVNARHSVVAGESAGALFPLIAATDFFDGRLARRAGGVSPRGRALDHGADIVFVLSALATYAALGIVPWWVPAAIVAAFASYAYDAWRATTGHRPADRVASRIGHLGGVLNWVLIGVLVYNTSAGIDWLSSQVLSVFYAIVPLYSGAAIAQRWRTSESVGSGVRRDSSSGSAPGD